MTKVTHSTPTKSKELLMYHALLPRKSFSKHEKNHYDNLHKGHIGEKKFAELLRQHLSSDLVTLFGLLLESNQTEFQIDSVVMTHDTIYLVEVKYFEGDFYIENDQWFVRHSRKEIRNPLLQLQRSEFLFKQILQQLNVNLDVKSYVIFTNENFTLYQAPLDLPLVFPTQLTRFVTMLNSHTSRVTDFHIKLAEQLKALHITESKNSRLPEYNYSELRKGIVCKYCSSFLYLISRFHLTCKRCGQSDLVDTAVIRSVREFNFLFPDCKITTNTIYEWCAQLISKDRIRRIMGKEMIHTSNGRYSHYIFDKDSE